MFALLTTQSIYSTDEEPVDNTEGKKIKLTESRPAPAQEKLKKEIAALKAQYYSMQCLETSDFFTGHKEMNLLKLKIVEKEKDLKRKANKAVWSKGQRVKLKETITKLRFVLNICCMIILILLSIFENLENMMDSHFLS